MHAYADAEENYPGHFEADEYLQDMAAHLAELNRKAIDAVRILLELIGLNETQIDFDEQLAGIKEADFAKVEYFDEYLGAHNAVVDTVSRHLDRIGPLLEIPANVETERRVLRRMLRQIPHYLDSMETVPTREKDVQGALHPALRLAFPDVIREPVIRKQTKTYKPDVGIDSFGDIWLTVQRCDAASLERTFINGAAFSKPKPAAERRTVGWCQSRLELLR